MTWQWWLSQFFATISLIFLVISFQQVTSKRILIFKMFSTFAALIGTIFLGNISAVILCSVGAYRNVTGLYFAYHPTTPKKVRYGTRISVLVMLVFFNILFWVNYTNILSIILGILCLLTYIQRHPEKIRRYAIVAHIMGIIYYIILVSPMNITIEVFGMTSVIIGILRFDIVKFDLNFSSKMLAYYEAMKSMYVDKITVEDEFINISSNDIKDGKWNFVYSNRDDVDATFEKSQSRVYVLSKNLSQDKLNRCFNKYNVCYENSWFCNDLSKVKLKLKSDLRIQIELCEDKDIVINTIIEGFNLNDPSYRDTLERKWDLEDTIHLIAKYEGDVAGLASCTIKGDVAYLCNVTTLKQYKGHGIAKELILNMIKVFKDREVKQVIFSTPKDGFTEVFYKRLGFTVVEYGYCLE